MRTKMQVKKDRTKRYKAMIVAAIGNNYGNYSEEDGVIWFRPRQEITIQMLTALSEAMGTDRINISCGRSGEPGYSELTPGTSDQVGYIQVLLPVKILE